MQKLDSSPSVEQTIIIVAPPNANIRVVRAPVCDVLAFASADEFEQWVVERSAAGTISDDVRVALTQVGCTMTALPRRLRAAIETLGRSESVPHLVDVESGWTSRRSFYRTWCARIRETPSAFLRRIRAIHARRLLAAGMSRKEAALAAGFSSVDQMRRHVGRKTAD